jgi:hypothetical protein
MAVDGALQTFRAEPHSGRCFVDSPLPAVTNHNFFGENLRIHPQNWRWLKRADDIYSFNAQCREVATNIAPPYLTPHKTHEN